MLHASLHFFSLRSTEALAMCGFPDNFVSVSFLCLGGRLSLAMPAAANTGRSEIPANLRDPAMHEHRAKQLIEPLGGVRTDVR